MGVVMDAYTESKEFKDEVSNLSRDSKGGSDLLALQKNTKLGMGVSKDSEEGLNDLLDDQDEEVFESKTGSIKVSLIVPNGITIFLDVDSEDKVKGLKEAINEVTEVPIEEQKILLEEEEGISEMISNETEKTLSECGIVNGSKIKLMNNIDNDTDFVI